MDAGLAVYVLAVNRIDRAIAAHRAYSADKVA